MAQEARLMLGPRDGEVLGIVEPKPTIEIICHPAGRHVESDDTPEYDVAIYTLGRHIGPGVFQYDYSGIKPRESEDDESPQD